GAGAAGTSAAFGAAYPFAACSSPLLQPAARRTNPRVHRIVREGTTPEPLRERRGRARLSSRVSDSVPRMSSDRPAPSSDESPRVKLSATMVTDVGVVRDHNEDSAHVDGASQFFIVADGMGG